MTARSSTAKSPSADPSDAPNPLVQFLRLSSEQAAQYAIHLSEFHHWETSQQTLIRDWLGTGCTALAGSPLDPVTIGTPFWSIAKTEKEIARRKGELLAANQSLLTTEQKMRLQILSDACSLGNLVSSAEEGYLLESPAYRAGSSSEGRPTTIADFEYKSPCRRGLSRIWPVAVP